MEWKLIYAASRTAFNVGQNIGENRSSNIILQTEIRLQMS